KPHAGCKCRKPEPQMLHELAEKHRIDLKKSYMVGDRTPDIEAGRKAGTKNVLGGNRKEKVKAELRFNNLHAIAIWLKEKEKYALKGFLKGGLVNERIILCYCRCRTCLFKVSAAQIWNLR